MRFKVVGYGDLPEEGYRDEWWTEILKTESTIPPEGLPAINVLKKAGIPIKGMYLMHEAPKLLPAPTPEKKELPDIMPAVRGILAIAAFAGAILGILFVAALRIDPVLVCVLSDGTHLECAKWYDFTSPSASYRS